MGLLKRWVIEQAFESGGELIEWEPVGTAAGLFLSADEAIARARTHWPDLRRGSQLRAINWDDATTDQREAALAENEVRGEVERLRGDTS